MTQMVSERTMPVPAVSWAAILAGSGAAAAFALVLFTLGIGLGLSAISPWGGSVTGSTLGHLAIAWLLAVQLFAFGLGGYIAGRLRISWAGIDRDETFFRDTAHGLLVWCVGTVLCACLAAALFSNAVSTTASAVAVNASSQTQSFAESLLRSDGQGYSPEAAKKEIGLIFGQALNSDLKGSEDRSYAIQLIAKQTGLSQADAEQRWSQTMTKAKIALEAGRKLALQAALWVFVAMLIGAFAASYMATVGGEARDEVD